MKERNFRMRRAIAAVLIGAWLIIAGIDLAKAASQDYAFVAVPPTVQTSKEAIIHVRLMNKLSGKPVTDAVIFQARMDMGPDGMADMAAKLLPLVSNEPGIYRFQSDLSMTGRWALRLAAKVPGEHETLRGEVIIIATK